MKRHYDPTFGYKLGFWPAVFLSIVASIQARQSATMLKIGLGKILRQASFMREPCLISRMTTRLTDPSFSSRNQCITDPYLRNTFIKSKTGCGAGTELGVSGRGVLRQAFASKFA
jgi:hypothetical protein